MNRITSVTVYCSASGEVPDVYLRTAHELGRGISSSGWSLVYGGNYVGCMAAVADGARAGGGKVIGITPRLMVDEGIADERCDELVVTDGMRERKALLELRGDAFVALPGGMGTFEELFEILVGRLLGYHDKPIVLLNVNDYYGPLLAMIEHGIEQRFIKPKARDAYFVAGTVDAAIRHLRRGREPGIPTTGPGAEPSARE